MTDASDPAPSPDSPTATTAHSPSAQRPEGTKVIFEQVVIALILAFTFRAFVVEAFVIPTGSMATTLLGAHMRFDCPDCGWNFSINYPTEGGTTAIPSQAVTLVNGVIRPRVYNIRCPNCGYRLPPENPVDPDNDASAPPVYHGDRILVLKHLYLLKDPDRWDVVVFKNPNRRASRYAAMNEDSTEAFQENYIKRLIGLPGETLVLLGGDVFVADPDTNKALAELEPSDFRIARKGDVAQEALWRVVYDDDHRPRGLDRDVNVNGLMATDAAWQMPWRMPAEAGWQQIPTTNGGGFAFDNPQGRGTLYFDPAANRYTFALTDYLAYDVTANEQTFSDRDDRPAITFGREFPGRVGGGSGQPWLSWVSDLKLQFYYERRSGDGVVELLLSKQGDDFIAQLRPNSVRLIRRTAEGRELLLTEVEEEGLFAEGAGRFVQYENVDYRLRLRVDGRTVIETTDEQYSPDVAALIEEEQSDEVEPQPAISITAANQTARFDHLSVWRDVYYTARDVYGGFYFHASPESFPANVMRLGTDEYFVLGDNPFLSGDARTWIDPVTLRYEQLDVEGGRVPGRFLLGKAFFVYWPGGFPISDWLPSRLRIAPNFGDMRFIR